MREMRARWSFILLLLVIVQATTGQAPGDEDGQCVEDVVNEEDLMSSFNYKNLVPSTSGVGPWTVVDDDNNNDDSPFASVTTWRQSGGTCTRTVSVCGFSFGSQDNWLITQFINNTMRQAVIYIRVRYAITSQCEGGRGCLTTLDTYVLQTNTSDMSFTSNVSSIFITRPIAALTDTVRDGSTIVTRILPVTANQFTTGLYVAFRDLGTCIGLSEVTVFYPVCDVVLLDVGVNFSELGLPGNTSSGVCFTNMAIGINPLENSFTATCTLTSMLMSSQQTDRLFTNWTINGNTLPQCMCLPGYEFTNRTTSSQCQACEPFYFKNTLSNTEMCTPCPMFSSGSEPAMEVCPCDDGYFRPSDGSEDAMNCTRPPSAPQNIAVSDVTNTSVIIMWEAPQDNGDRTDLFYSISHNVTDDVFSTTSTNMMLTGLIPFVYYELRVTADNGVSSQDNNINARTVIISIMTEEGVGGVIDASSIHNINGERLTWDPPELPQGVITHYEVLANGSIFTTSTNQIDIRSFGLLPGVYFVQVRAVTSVGPGNYSEPFRLTITQQPGDGGDGSNIGPIIGAAVGGVIAIIIILGIVIIIIICVCKQRSGKHNVNDVAMSYAVQNDEDITKKLPGIRKYVDPQNYASPDAALKDFALEIPSHQLRLDEVIGGGEFGDVCRGIWYKPSSKHLSVAIKTLKPGSPYKDRVDFLMEASIMGQFHHLNVITLHGVVTKSQPVMIVMEYMENKSLDVYLRKNDDLLGPKRLVTMAKGVAAGMRYFGEIGFVHRDLAARNVLVSKDEVCKIADFGLSRETVDNAYDVKTGGKIPIRWTAPEAIQYRKFTTSSDVWSFGVLLWEVMSYGQQPYWDWSNHKVLDEVEAGYRLELPKDCPQSVYQVMLDCWNLDHRLRPKFDEIGVELETLLQNNFKSARSNNNNQTVQSSICPLDYDSIEKWLQAIKMDRYLETFKQNGFMQPQDCLKLTRESLMDMGITLSGHQHKILSSVQTANSRLQREPSYKI